jgi:hypothetical protein
MEAYIDEVLVVASLQILKYGLFRYRVQQDQIINSSAFAHLCEKRTEKRCQNTSKKGGKKTVEGKRNEGREEKGDVPRDLEREALMKEQTKRTKKKKPKKASKRVTGTGREKKKKKAGQNARHR